MTRTPPNFSTTALVVVAAGRGTRFGGWKQLAPIGGEPLLLWTLRALEALPFGERLVVLPAELLDSPEWAAIAAGLEHRHLAIPGGAERADSVRAGVNAASHLCEYVAVHDGARPFPPLDAIAECLRTLQQNPALAGAIVCAPVHDSLKIVEGNLITGAIPRDSARRAETPQLTRLSALREALADPEASSATDEAQALERTGGIVAAITHNGLNPKITTPEDITLAEALLRLREATPPQEPA